VNFVTGGKIAFTSTLEGTTTPTVPPFYWHDDFETETVGSPASKWTVVSGAWRIDARMQPTWHQHSPDNFDLRNFIIYFRSGEFGPQLGPYSVTSVGCTILATRWYPQAVVCPYDWIVLPL